MAFKPKIAETEEIKKVVFIPLILTVDRNRRKASGVFLIKLAAIAVNPSAC